MIGAEFLGMIMLIVYVGAVAVLFLFVVMMLNVAQQKNEWFSSEKLYTYTNWVVGKFNYFFRINSCSWWMET